MTLQEMLKDEHRAGVAKGREEMLEQTKDKIVDSLSKVGEVSDIVKERIHHEMNYDKLLDYYILSKNINSIEEFEEKMN